ncbi:MAG TPA: hypothetical protein VG148_16430 [Pyrinomonadaceae bacterium]|nr:hypothetical protein [Pyrinomonadaceae bacterium]
MNGVRLDLLKEAAARRLLTLVLLTVLVWYTAVVPAPAAAFVRRAGGGPRDAEEREDGTSRRPESGESNLTGPEDLPVADLDWPEFING